MYVQPPAPASQPDAKESAAPSTETLTIEAPVPATITVPQPAATSVTSTAPTQPPAKKPPRPKPDSHASEEPTEPETVPPVDTAQAPPLEPAASAASESDIAASQADIRKRIDGLIDANSAPADKQILDDARAFVSQSEQALKDHNLLKAKELAEKASLLLDALQARP